MRGLTVLFSALVMALGGYAPAQSPKSDDTSAGDLKALQGKWKIVKVWIGEKEIPAAEVAKDPEEIAISDKSLVFMKNGKAREYHRLTLDAKPTPKQLDIQETEAKGNVKQIFPAPKKGEKVKSVDVPPRKCLYELKGDRLKICLSPERGEDRPKSLEAKGEVVLIELERVK